VALFGVLTLLNDAASQSFLPRLVPQSALLAANARIDQGSAVAQTSGPLLAGALISALGAPLAVLVDAATYLFSAVAIWRVRIGEPTPPATGAPLNLRREIGEGLRWVYGHRTLAPFALSTHGWFLFNSMLGTVFAPFVLLGLGLNPFEFSIALAAAGVAGLLGAMISVRIGHRFGAGRAVIACRVLTPIAWGIVALAPARSADHYAIIAVLAAGQALHGLSMGASNANEMSYRQAVTPDALQGRMNTTMRSINRAMIVVGAPVGGLLADWVGYRPTQWIAIAGLTLVPVFLAASPFRRARHEDAST
jgi:predicted MFS family arabinose efflux permease